MKGEPAQSETEIAILGKRGRIKRMVEMRRQANLDRQIDDAISQRRISFHQFPLRYLLYQKELLLLETCMNDGGVPLTNLIKIKTYHANKQ